MSFRHFDECTFKDGLMSVLAFITVHPLFVVIGSSPIHTHTHTVVMARRVCALFLN